jgi:hypothetical protein
MRIGKFIGLKICDVDTAPEGDGLTEEAVNEMMRSARQKAAEEETQRSKGKWY